MAEAEALGDRLGIFVAGQLRALGSAQVRPAGLRFVREWQQRLSPMAGCPPSRKIALREVVCPAQAGWVGTVGLCVVVCLAQAGWAGLTHRAA